MAGTISRSDSLVAELTRRNLFEEFSQWCFAERPTLEEQQAWLEAREISRALKNVSMVARSPEWRMARAAWERARLDASLPPDLDQILRRSLLDQRFNHALGELSHKELMEHTQAMQSDEMIALRRVQVAQKDEEIDIAKRRVLLLEDNAAKAKAALEGIKSKGGLTPETLRQIEEAAGLL